MCEKLIIFPSKSINNNRYETMKSLKTDGDLGAGQLIPMSTRTHDQLIPKNCGLGYGNRVRALGTTRHGYELIWV